MPISKVVMVIDMQNGVFETPRARQAECVVRINRLIAAADTVIFVQHLEPGSLDADTDAFALLPDLHQPEKALYVTKTACDAFLNTSLGTLLHEQHIDSFVICGCATDYCVDATVKNAVSRGYHLTIADDAHTTADRKAVPALTLIEHYNDVWRDFIAPNPINVASTEQIVSQWARN